MFEKKATYTFDLQGAQALNKPVLSTFIKEQQLIVKGELLTDTIEKIAAASKESSEKSGDGAESPVFDLQSEIENHPDSLFIKCFAIKADETNDNGDFFSKEELVKATPTFVGVPLFTNHSNTDINEARGKVVHSWWDEDQNGIMIVGRVDAAAYPQLARGIKENYILGTSMGASRGHDLVTMADSTKKRVDEIQIGDEIITHSGNTEQIGAICQTQEHSKLYHIKWTGNLSGLALSYEHPVLVLKRESLYRKAPGGKKYRHFVNLINEEVKPEFVPASELKSEDYVLEWVDKKIEQDDINDDTAFLLGCYAAEGYTRDDFVEFCFGSNDTSIEKTISAIKQNFPGKVTLIDRTEDRNGYYVRSYSKNLIALCNKYVGTGSKNKKLHSKLLHWDMSLQKIFLGAYIDGDGCTIKERIDVHGHSTGKGAIQISSASLSLLRDTRQICLRIGCPAVLSTHERVATKSTVMAQDTKYVEHMLYISNGITTIMQKYSQKAAIAEVAKQQRYESFFYKDFLAHKIKEVITIDNSEPTYYLQVGGFDDQKSDRSYILNDIAAHNCQVQYSLCSICHNHAETPDQYCFEESTPILMEDFTCRPISLIKIGDRVIDAWGHPTTITHTFKHHENDKLLVMKSRSICGEIVTTKNHPFLVKSRGEYRYCPSEFLADNHELYTPISQIESNNSFFGKFGFDNFDENQRLSLCRLLGYYAAEGSRVIRDGRIKAIELTFHIDEIEYINDVFSICVNLFQKEPSVYTNQSNKNTTRIRLWLPEIAEKIHNICPGVVHKHRTKRFDSSIFTLAKKYIIQLLYAFTDGDGYSDPNGAIIINSACQGLASQLYYLFMKVGAAPSFGYFKNGGGPTSRDKTFDCYRLHIGNSQLNNFGTVGTKIATALATKTSNSSKLTNVFTEDGLFAKHHLYSIDEVQGGIDVYNIETESHSYVANNTSVHNCEHIRERKTRQITSRTQKCDYHKQGSDKECPISGSKKGDKKKFAVDSKSFEYNYGIKFIENSFVVNPACDTCGITEVIDPQKFLAKVAEIQEILPRLLKAAQNTPLTCTDKQCIKIAGQSEIDSLNQALDLLSSVSQAMLSQKEQIDLEFLSDLVKVLADLQTVVDELTEQGYGRLQSPGEPMDQSSQEQVGAPGEGPPGQVTNAVQPVNPTAGGGSKVHSGPAGQVGNVTSHLAGVRSLNLEKMAERILGGKIKELKPVLRIKSKDHPNIKIASKVVSKSLDIFFNLQKK